jgi:hypothetical protein
MRSGSHVKPLKSDESFWRAAEELVLEPSRPPLSSPNSRGGLRCDRLCHRRCRQSLLESRGRIMELRRPGPRQEPGVLASHPRRVAPAGTRARRLFQLFRIAAPGLQVRALCALDRALRRRSASYEGLDRVVLTAVRLGRTSFEVRRRSGGWLGQGNRAHQGVASRLCLSAEPGGGLPGLFGLGGTVRSGGLDLHLGCQAAVGNMRTPYP